MPWCPNCKTEYRKGFTICSDCNTPLEEKLVDDEMIPFFQAEEKIIAERLVSYFDYSGLTSDIRYHEENQVYVVSIPAEKQMEAKKLYQAFYFVEREKAEKESLQKENVSENLSTASDAMMDDIAIDSNNRPPASASYSNEIEQVTNGSRLSQDEIAATEDASEDELEVEGSDEDLKDNEPITYVMKSEQYKDLKSTVWIFLFFGIAGILILVLNLVGIFNFINGFIPYIVMGALFLFFLYVAISTNHKANLVQAEIEEENKLTEKINKWLKDNITKDYLETIHINSNSTELNYIKATEHIHDLLIKEFGPQNSAYLDRLIDEYYSNYLDEND